MSDFKTKYPQSNADTVAATITLASLGSSASFVAGRESAAISNRTNLDLDHVLSGKVTVGTSPTGSTYIQIWVVPALSVTSGTPAWPDVFDGTDSAETATSAGILQACGILVKSILVDSTTSDRAYPFGGVSLRDALGALPTDYVIFVTHNTGVNLNSTGGNHEINYLRVQEQSV